MLIKHTVIPEASSSPPYVEYEQFIIFGDSITQGSCDQGRGFAFSPALQSDYIRRFDIINRGFSGYTSQQALAIFPSFFPPVQKAKVRLMIVFFGANDAVLPGFEQHVPLPTYEANLRKILTHPLIKEHKETNLLLLTPPPVDEYQFSAADTDTDMGTDTGTATPSGTPEPASVAVMRKASQTKKYADACRQVGKALNVPVADIWTAFMTAAGWVEGQPLPGSRDVPANKKLQALLSDGLHFNPAGYQVMYDEVTRAIRTHYPHLTPGNVPIHFPPWQTAPKL
ncbi:GDSL Lipase/Acylhydrolase [Histoplasma capsulatum G186AR]|uniref:GDSL Lipase/Acylhydrolase n=1 Tax=Ajellomyces capsulatus TaxID=5037 RepID=A0A8H7ZAK7_AJECA|nr:GDSL Lipase/Acylhydrolase [Histoplasma capsulatum]QSS69812.1 GDSL Lipase/Acylhydrolase [Histoplasma capsulatum G186AR]